MYLYLFELVLSWTRMLHNSVVLQTYQSSFSSGGKLSWLMHCCDSCMPYALVLFLLLNVLLCSCIVLFLKIHCPISRVMKRIQCKSCGGKFSELKCVTVLWVTAMYCVANKWVNQLHFLKHCPLGIPIFFGYYSNKQAIFFIWA